MSLHPWDERFHALVAKNLVEHPFRPALLPSGYADSGDTWQSGEVWLHKPPLALWAMAASMATLGQNELAMRLPSLLWGVLAVLLTYQIGRKLLDEQTALVAASFQVANSFLISLSSGRRVADHVDTLLVVTVEAGVLALVAMPPGLARSATVGALSGLGVLTKSFPGLLPLAVLAAVELRNPTNVVKQIVTGAGVAAVVAGPWLIYAAWAFPAESARELQHALLHFSQVVEGHSGSWSYYLEGVSRLYGELTLVAVVVAGVSLSPGPRLVVLAWMLAPYVIFSLAATKLHNLTVAAAPAVFLCNGVLVRLIAARIPRDRGALRTSAVVALVLAAILPVRALFEPQGPLERRDRFPREQAMYRTLDTLPAPQGAPVYNAQDHISAMFYTKRAVYPRMPSDDEVRQLHAKALVPIVITRNSTGEMPQWWRAVVVDYRAR